MKTFKVIFKEDCYGEIEVDAENEDEAQDKAYEMWSEGKAIADGSIEYKQIDITEV